MAALVLTVTAYSLIFYTPWFLRFLAGRVLFRLIFIDYLLIAILVALTGGLQSAYFFFVAIPVIIVGHWYGTQRLLQLLAFGSAATLASVIFPAPYIVDFHPVGRAIAYATTLVMIGMLVNRLTSSERAERSIALAATQKAQSERNRLVSLITSIADPVIATDQKGHISDYNSAALDLLNTNTIIKGQNIQHHIKFITANDNKPVDMIKAAAIGKNSTLKRNDLAFINNSQEKVNLYVSVAHIAAGSLNRDEGLIFVLRDITKEKSLEEQRDEFISVTSHELRTPLAIAEANLSTALLPQAPKLDPTQKNLIEQAHQNVIFLGQLVNDLTTLAEAEKDKLQIAVTTIDPVAILQRLEQDYKQKAAEKGLTLKITIGEQLPAVVTSEQHIREILQNFVTNAIKYTQKGGIIVGAHRAHEAPDNLLFSVTDTGIGVSTSDQKHVFDKFYRSEDYRTRETGGTGLGLYITKKLAQRLSARVWFTSKLNQGSTFFLQVPPFSRLKRDQGQVIQAQIENVISNI